MDLQKEDENLVLKIENVGKDYILGAVTGETLKDALKAKRGKKGSGTNRTFTALDGVNLEVRKGEAVGIIGSNGAGKSTLLKLISRITAPSRGRILIDGKIASMLEVGTGFHPELTGRENIYLNGSILGMNREEIDAKLDSIIEFSEVAEFIDTPVKRYSSGMYVKLAFSVAAHLDSDIMIMDEVLAVGDIKFQHKCLNKMKEIAKEEGRTILYVSHNMETIHMLCDRCIVMDHGHVAFDGAVEEATRIYLGVDSKTDTTADFTSYMRPGWLGRDDSRFTYAKYPDRTNNVVTEKSIKVEFSYKNKLPVNNLGLRIELMSGEDKPFAAQVFYDLVSGQAQETGSFSVELDLSKVMDGKYQTYYTLFALDPYDETIDIDCVRGLDLDVRRKTADGKLRWRNESWGNIQL